MDSELLRTVQLTQLDIAKELQKICEKHHITYFIDVRLPSRSRTSSRLHPLG